MNKDLLLGFAISLFVHTGLIGVGEALKPKPAIITQKNEEAPLVELFDLPPVHELEPPPQETPQEGPAEETTALAPPSLTDTPSLVIDSAFVQRLQPPPPPGLPKATGQITIPPGRPATGSLRTGLGNVFDLANLDQRPEARFRATPVYPEHLKRAGVTGHVVVMFIVDPTGAVREASAVRSTHRDLETPALQCIQKFKFSPGRKGGVAVSTQMRIQIEFTLNTGS
jgi:protein TonB